MRKSLKVLSLLALAVPALAGCSNPFARASQAAARYVPPSGNADLAMGRQALVDGQYGTAIAALRFARLDPACSAEAANALGVAYARIGRGDLAERYFREALALAPADRRFAANLARFEQVRFERLAQVAATPAPAAAPVQPLQGRVHLVLAGPSRSVTVGRANAPLAIRVTAPLPARAVQLTNGRAQVSTATPRAHLTILDGAPVTVRPAPSARQLAMARGPLVRRALGPASDFD